MNKKNVWIIVFFMSLSICKAPRITGNRVPSKPFISGDGFRSMVNHVFDETDRSLKANEIKYADIVFVKSDYLHDFFSLVHPGIKTKYILVSHNSDGPAPGPFLSYLDDEKVLRWYGQNPSIMYHKKFVPIPIGIANRYVGSTGNVQNFLNVLTPLTIKKSRLLGINFQAGTNLSSRKYVFDYFINKRFCEPIFDRKHFEYLKKMRHTKFILSPCGNGLDCHRTWEALILKTIPVLKSSEMNELLADLPVVIVEDWETINEEFLKCKYKEIEQKGDFYNMDKVTYDYWHQLLLDKQKKFREVMND